MTSIIKSFWTGEDVTNLEILTIKSFIENGHIFHLYAYDPTIERYFPKHENFAVKDANEIYDKSKFFTYKGQGDCSDGSVGGFSDIFRYYLMYKLGGWYVDMDTTCFKNFDSIENEIVLRPHINTKVVANIAKFPANDPVLKELIDRTERDINEQNSQWMKPLWILRDTIDEMGYSKYIVDENLFGCDNADIIRDLLKGNYFETKHFVPEYGFHWCSSACKTGRWDRNMKYNFNDPVKLSFYHVLLKKFKLA